MIKMPEINTPPIPLQPPVYFCPRAKAGWTLDGKIHKPFEFFHGKIHGAHKMSHYLFLSSNRFASS